MWLFQLNSPVIRIQMAIVCFSLPIRISSLCVFLAVYDISLYFVGW